MGTLLLIRHGQTSSYGQGVDHLTDIGRAQARKVGEALLKNGARFDTAIAGDLLRQQQTAQIVAEVYRDAGESFPDIETRTDWNEYDAPGVTSALVPVLAERDPDFAQKVQEFQAAMGTPDQNRYFQRVFEIAMTQWVNDAFSVPGVEPFSTFRQRVVDARSAITGDPKRRSVAVFTSGGPIGVSVQDVLQAPPMAAMELNWRVRNASITELLFGRDRISLDSFNALAHLDSPELLTFR